MKWIDITLVNDACRLQFSMLELSVCNQCDFGLNYHILYKKCYQWVNLLLSYGDKRFNHEVYDHIHLIRAHDNTTTNEAQQNRVHMSWDVPCHICPLIHQGRVTHICVSRLTIIGSNNGLSPSRRQAIIWTNAGILLIGPIGTSFNEIVIEFHTFMKMQLKMSSGKWRPVCLGINVLNWMRRPHDSMLHIHHMSRSL